MNEEYSMILRGTTADFRGVELAFFRLKNDVSEAQLLAFSERVDNMFLANQEGLLARFLLRVHGQGTTHNQKPATRGL